MNKRNKPIKKLSVRTTLKLLREQSACESGYKKLRKSLPKAYGDNKPINLLRVLRSNGVQDTLWCFQATVEPWADIKHIPALMAADFAESVLPKYESVYPNDDRPRKAIEACRAFVRVEISSESAAWSARSAARSAWSARSAESARSAAESAAWSARSAAEAAAWSAESARSARSAQVKTIKKYLK